MSFELLFLLFKFGDVFDTLTDIICGLDALVEILRLLMGGDGKHDLILWLDLMDDERFEERVKFLDGVRHEEHLTLEVIVHNINLNIKYRYRDF